MTKTKIFASIAAAAMLAACSSPVKVNEQQAEPMASTPASQPAPATAVVATVDPLNDVNGVLAKRSVYFDYDSYVVRQDDRQILENHAGYLNQNKDRKIIIQGNTDERGGTEYNLALGQRRAEAVRQSLSALGVAPNQMEAVSLGEVKPKATGSGEAVWSQNRRADIVY